MPWAVPIIAAGVTAYGQHRQQKKQNQLLRGAANQLSPEQVLRAAEHYDPALWWALQGPQGGYVPQQIQDSPMFQQLYAMSSNPGYIDPQIMNLPYQISSQRGQQDLSAAQTLLGRSGMGMAGGGIGNAYALSNLAAKTGRNAQIGQQYGLWREQQRRADLGFLQGGYQNLLGLASGNQGGMANILQQQQAPTPWATMLGNMMGAGMSAYGQFRQQPQQVGGLQSPFYGGGWGGR